MWCRAVGYIVTFTLSLLAAPLVAHAQRPGHVPVIGMLTPQPAPQPACEAFRQGLRALGYLEGHNILLEYRFADGRFAQLPTLATELVQHPVDILVTDGTPAALAADLVRLPVDGMVASSLTIDAARQATASIPIVMAADPDPVRSGFVASLARPGGNITGLSTQAFDLEAKQLALLRDALPSLVRVGGLTNATPPDRQVTERLEAAARALHLELTAFPIRESAQLPTAFAAIHAAGVGPVLCRGTLWCIDAPHVAALVRTHRLPTLHNVRQFVEAGALLSYGVDFAVLHRRVATFVDKILQGANPAELPVEQPMKLELVINLETAQALGLTMPSTLLFQADEVIR